MFVETSTDSVQTLGQTIILKIIILLGNYIRHPQIINNHSSPFELITQSSSYKPKIYFIYFSLKKKKKVVCSRNSSDKQHWNFSDV